LLDSTTVTATCAVGGWDTVGGTCTDPRVTSASITGNYYNQPGTMSLTCSNSNAYRIENADTSAVIDSGTYSVGPILASAPVSGNYRFTCIHGSYAGPPVLVFYNSPPPPAPTINLDITPKTINPDEKVTADWNVTFPTSTCSLTAKVVCTNNACTAAQTAFQNTLDTMLANESTDANDPHTSRSIPVAVKNLAPGELDTTFRALGKKTFKVKFTTDITYSCGPGLKETKRIQVTTSQER
jgi:hypothetical protein